MPRWRTMIEPAVTSWPSPALTPRRWPTLSRPFLTLPPAFLCAIVVYSSFFVARVLLRRGRLGVGGRPWPSAVGLGGRLFGSGGLRWRPSARLPWRPASARLGVGLAGLGLGLGRLLRPRPSVRPSARCLGADRQLGGELGVLGGLRGGGLLEALALGLGVRRRPSSTSAAALLPSSVMSLMRRTVSSWRWPFLTRLRAFGRYLKR